MAKIEPGMESMLDMYFYETNSLLEQLDEILLRTEQANSFDRTSRRFSVSCIPSKVPQL